MNFYPRFPADYLAKTLHLSLAEDGAYGRLLDWCYANEKPIPHEKRYEIARVSKQKERQICDRILSEFFTRTDQGWSNERVAKETAKAQPKILTARENGRKGGRPHKNPTGYSEKPSGLSPENRLGFLQKPTGKAHQNQNHKEQKQELLRPQVSSEKPAPEPEPPPSPSERENTAPALPISEGARACLAMRQAGAIRVNPSHPILLAGIAEGASIEMYANAVREAIDRGKSEPFAYAIAAVRGQLAEAKQPPQEPTHANRSPSRSPSRKRSVVERVEAAIVERREREAAAAAPGTALVAKLAG